MRAIASPLVVWVEWLIASDAVPWDVRKAVDASDLEKRLNVVLICCAHTFLIEVSTCLARLPGVTGDGTHEEPGRRARRIYRS